MTRAKKTAPTPRRRKPIGSVWRIAAGDNHEVTLESNGAHIFDELVIDNWFHLEQMDRDHWWMRVGDHMINVHVKPGKPPEVIIEEDPRPDEEWSMK